MIHIREGAVFLGEIDRIAEVLHKHKQDPRYLLAILLDIQESENYISIEAMRAAAEYLGVSESRVFAVVTFYRTLSQKKKAERSYVSAWVLHAISADQLLFFMNWKKAGH